MALVKNNIPHQQFQFMNNIINFYIIDGKGDIFFSHDVSEELNQGVLSNIFATMQLFARDYGSKEVNVIEFGSSKLFSTRDDLTNISFILNCEKTAKPKKIFQMLNKIKNLFIQKFTGNFYSNNAIKIELMNSFKADLDDIILKQNQVESFLGII